MFARIQYPVFISW